MRARVETYTLDFLLDYFNTEIQKIDSNWRLYKRKRVNIKSNSYFSELLNKSLKSIFSAPITGRSKEDQNHNKELIDNIYKIGNKEKTEKIKNVLEMKYKNFFNNYTTYKKAKEKNKLKEINDDIKAMLEDFVNYLKIRLFCKTELTFK